MFIREYLDIYSLDIGEVDIFGILKSGYKESTGIPKIAIKKNDLDFLILATAINHNAVLISNDTIFSKIAQTSPNLKYENWTK